MADNFICEGESVEWVIPLIKWHHPDAPYFSILLCLTPDDFTRQVESASPQRVKWNIILIASNKFKGDSPLWHKI
jgi:hypothetical protein